MPIFRRATALLATCCVLALGAPLRADVSGPYLAARGADRAADFAQAAMYYTQALVQDSANPVLMDGLVRNQIMAGNLDGALPVARRLQSLGQAAQSTRMALMAEQVKRGAFDLVLKDLDSGEVVAPLVDGLTRGWAELGTGRMSEALEAFDAMAAQEGLAFFGLYHKALALALVGDLEAADALLGDPALGLRFTRRAVIAHLQILSMLDRPAEALDVMAEAFPGDDDSDLAAIRAALEAGKPLPFDTLRSAADGVAEVYLLMATALRAEGAEQAALLHARMASYLRPDLHDAALMSAAALDALGQYDLAEKTYATIPEASALGVVAVTGQAQAQYAAGRKDDALALLSAQTAARPEIIPLQLALADMLRQEERWEDAAAAYSRAVDLMGQPEGRNWAVFYSRAIAYERGKQWDKAEPDFRRALELNPDQPQVLNYLGYSLLERHSNLEEALAMIERAVEQRPEDGYIIDSLAWGLFLLGRYDEALPHMERASLLMPVDAVVTDHLGDVYWAVGRLREARFQWRRALSFAPEEKDALRIRRKLEVGLDAVLAEEGAPALDARAP